MKVVECVLWRREGAIKSTSKWLLVNIQGDFAGQGKQFSNVIFRQLQAVIITWVIGTRLPEKQFLDTFLPFRNMPIFALASRFSLIDSVFLSEPGPIIDLPFVIVVICTNTYWIE